MWIDALQVTNFRNIESLHLRPGRHLNLFLGENAQGKTSLLESIYFLSQLKSFRTKTLTEVVGMGAQEAQVESIFSTSPQSQNEVKIRLGLENRKLILNQKEISREKYHGKMNSVVFSPESLSAIKGGPEGRRTLVDTALNLVFEEAPRVLRRYDRVVKERNAWLRRIKAGELDIKTGRDLVESLNGQFIQLATDLLFLRIKFLAEITPHVQSILGEVLGQETAFLLRNMSHEQPWYEMEWSNVRERLIAEVLDPERRLIEEKIGRTMSGPHLHDISFVFSGQEARSYCSQGQQRAVILAFKISEIVYHKRTLGNYPILLLDDVLSEFDQSKQKYLVNFLNKNEAQTFLTATECETLAGAETFNIDSGKVRKA